MVSVVKFMDNSLRNEIYWETTSSSIKSSGVVISSLIWLLERMKTKDDDDRGLHTQRCLILNVLN